MKIIKTLIILIGFSVSAQVSVDTTSIEYKEHIKQEKELYEKAKKKSEVEKLKKSIFGTNSTTYGFHGYNYNSYANGKYSEVAKAESWSKWSLPENRDERLAAYERNRVFKIIILSVLALIVLLWFVRKKNRSNVK